MKASAKTHRGEDAQADPVGAPQRLLLHVTHILQREARERDGQPHGRDTCTECEENKEGGEEQRQSERRYESESVQYRGHFKGWERASEW